MDSSDEEGARRIRKRDEVSLSSAISEFSSASKKAALDEDATREAHRVKMREAYKDFLENFLKEGEEDPEPEDDWIYFRDSWNRVWADESTTFEDVTSIPAMRFTNARFTERRLFNSSTECGFHHVSHCDTLQIVSVRVAEVTGGLQWPLEVYGLIAVRDVLDHKRNMIFDRKRDNCQTVHQEDPYLKLTGPTRGVVVSFDATYIEVLLKVKGSNESEDKDLSSIAAPYRAGHIFPCMHTSKLSTLELQYYPVSCCVETTITTVRVVDGQWPHDFQGMFTATTALEDGTEDGFPVTLLDFKDHELSVAAAGGVIKLSRSVVCVERDGRLKVSVLERGGKEEASAYFTPMDTGSSIGKPRMGSCLLEVSVAWSLFNFY